MMAIDGVIAFLALFVVFVALGFFGSRWRKGDLNNLTEWALGGKRLGTYLVWFLVGADLYTAYTFIAIPSGVYAKGAIYNFAVPYVALTFGLAILFMPRLWRIAHEKGYVTGADFAKGTFNSTTLAMLIAIVGITAELPYIALQIVGMQAVLSTMLAGVSDVATVSEVSLIIAFIVLAAFTYTSGLRGATLTAVMKDIIIFGGIIAVIIVVAVAGGFSSGFTAKPVYSTLAPTLENAYWSIFIVSALGLYLYPHAINGVLSGQDAEKVRKSTALLPIYGIGLGLLAMYGVLIYGNSPALDFVKSHGGSGLLVVPSLIQSVLPAWAAGIAFLGIFIGGLVPAAIMAISQANLLTRNIVKEFRPNLSAEAETQIAKWASVAFKFIALAFVFVVNSTYAVQLQLFGTILIVQTLPAMFGGLITSRLNKNGLIVGLVAGEAAGIYLMADANKFGTWSTSFFSTPPFGAFYVGATALALNMVIVLLWTMVSRPKARVTQSA
ncbi:MAG: sodium:solute symporter [Nitrososphaerota archaeon]|jgi:SSS family solute:Na+ symporter|nr:sodium:solute symporter [Nitrososphaerota archaeon]MDG6942186.1 sodium:solute symporter [Nitrososphaerota archaeon]MDG6942651.1 sodium:solute symporter [Nitrososphaerota archaeon]MDG6948438.1 sodium:solute symporter [Nitrososphaerota archaeon]MDG6950364.1 sodium:solute symporter [Nitrososphaerota archaeon]